MPTTRRRKSQPFSLRLSPQVLEEIQTVARLLERPSSFLVTRLIEEGLKQRRCPGILFTDGPAGRRATVAGTGIDVWEVIRVWQGSDKNLDAVARALPQLSRRQLESALHYYRSYPAEIDERLAREAAAEADLAHRVPLVRRYPG